VSSLPLSCCLLLYSRLFYLLVCCLLLSSLSLSLSVCRCSGQASVIVQVRLFAENPVQLVCHLSACSRRSCLSLKLLSISLRSPFARCLCQVCRCSVVCCLPVTLAVYSIMPIVVSVGLYQPVHVKPVSCLCSVYRCSVKLAAYLVTLASLNFHQAFIVESLSLVAPRNKLVGCPC
jgi:hypothetical protein